MGLPSHSCHVTELKFWRKRDRNLDERGVDFRDAALIFENAVVEAEDRRSDYGESRVRALGHVDDDYYLVVYSWRGRQSPDHQRVEGRRRWQEKISSVTRSKNLRLYGPAARRARVPTPTPRSARLTRIFGSTLTWSCRARAKLPYTFV
ncbi:MAG: hypothetical protein DMD99_18935 [Candidatus Rokuibacteriota bacterium]|nr:MAG: hypothetical protein DMD99_18935 [Candidatus Rokubacteria bacterium]